MMKESDFHWLRDRVLNIETVVTRTEAKVNGNTSSITTIEEELVPIKKHVYFMQNGGSIAAGILLLVTPAIAILKFLGKV